MQLSVLEALVGSSMANVFGQNSMVQDKREIGSVCVLCDMVLTETSRSTARKTSESYHCSMLFLRIEECDTEEAKMANRRSEEVILARGSHHE